MLQIVMPMGGLGNRFKEAGYTTPKALIEVDGKAMFLRALDSFENFSEKRNIFIIRDEHVAEYQLDQKIKQLMPSAIIHSFSGNTRGAVETVMLAQDLITDDEPVIVADCDIYFRSKAYEQLINQQSSADGVLLTFEADDPRYSYAETDESGTVIRTAEKIVISSHAILGGYFFSSGRLLKDLAAEFLSQPLPENLKEYFMSHLFNLMIQQGKRVKTASADEKHIFGTPEELNAYNRLQYTNGSH